MVIPAPSPFSPSYHVLLGPPELPPFGHHHHALRAIKSAYELPTPTEAEERRRRISATAEEMLGNTATETTLPWRTTEHDAAARSEMEERRVVHYGPKQPRIQYWATRSSVRLFARTAHSWDSE